MKQTLVMIGTMLVSVIACGAERPSQAEFVEAHRKAVLKNLEHYILKL